MRNRWQAPIRARCLRKANPTPPAPARARQNSCFPPLLGNRAKEKARRSIHKTTGPFLKLGCLIRFKLTTSWATTRRSNQLSYRHHLVRPKPGTAHNLTPRALFAKRQTVFLAKKALHAIKSPAGRFNIKDTA